MKRKESRRREVKREKSRKMGQENSRGSNRIRGEMRERRGIKIRIWFNECSFLSGAEIQPCLP